MTSPAEGEAPPKGLPVSGLLSLLSLYFVQGLPYGFQAVAVPVILIERGVAIQHITLLGVALGLPWILKVLWAPLVDVVYWERLGRRRSWLLPMQAGLILACLAMAAFGEDSSVPLLLLIVFLMNLFSATMDIAVDGYAIDLLEEEQLGYGNIAQVVGAKIGMLVGGGLLLSQQERIGYPGMFMIMSVCVLVVAMWTWWQPEAPGASVPAAALRTSLRDKMVEAWAILRRVLSRPDTRALLVFVLTYKAGESLADALFKPFLAAELGYSTAEIGRLVGTWGMLFSLTGSFLGGVLASQTSLLRAVTLCAVLRVLPIAAEWWLVAGFSVSPDHVLAITCAEHFFGGALTTATFAFMMSRVDERMGASHYTLLATLEVVGKLAASAQAGFWVSRFGYAPIFGAATGLSLLFLLVLIPLQRLQPPSRGEPASF